MFHHDPQPPALLPVLSRGKHRNPQKGACFIEFASLLAGERWSDHPACTHTLLAELDGRPAGDLEAPSRHALARAPQAARWASRFTAARSASVTPRRFRDQAAPTIVRSAVVGIAQACVPDPDAILRDLLVQAIDACATWGVRDAVRSRLDPAPRPRDARAL